jgi:hypothetical protein
VNYPNVGQGRLTLFLVLAVAVHQRRMQKSFKRSIVVVGYEGYSVSPEILQPLCRHFFVKVLHPVSRGRPQNVVALLLQQFNRQHGLSNIDKLLSLFQERVDRGETRELQRLYERVYVALTERRNIKKLVSDLTIRTEIAYDELE